MNPLSFVPVVGPLLGGAAGVGVSGVLGFLGALVAQAAVWVTRGVGALIANTTRPNLTAGWFRDRYGVMVSLAAIALVAVLTVSAAHAVVRQDPGILVRVLLVQLPLAVVLTGAAAGIVQWALSGVDLMSRAVSAGAGGDANRLLTNMAGTLAVMSAGPTIPAFVTLVVSLLVVAGGFLLWIELVLRSAAVDATTLFLPLALVTLTWPAASRIARRLAETLAALVLSKLVVVGVLSLGVGAVAAGGTGAPGSGGISAVLPGMALLLMAAVAPYALLRLIPLAESGAITHLEGMARRATVRPAMAAWNARSLLAGGGGAEGVGVEGGAEEEAASPGMAHRGADWYGEIPLYSRPAEPPPPPRPLPPPLPNG